MDVLYDMDSPGESAPQHDFQSFRLRGARMADMSDRETSAVETIEALGVGCVERRLITLEPPVSLKGNQDAMQ